MKQKNLIRITGLSGVAGGILLFAADMLLYYNNNQTDRLLNMAQAADWRIELSGVFALLATWLYLFGVVPVYYAFGKSRPYIQITVTVLLGAILIAYGVIHGAYTAIAVSAKSAYWHQLNMIENTRLAIETNQLMRLLVYPVFGILSVLFIYQVLTKKTYYSVWIIPFFPLLPFLLRKQVKNLLHGQWEIIVWGGYLNLIVILFLLASLISLWNKNLD